MPYITFATLLLIAASGFFSLYRQIQVLQQNSYVAVKYLNWIKDSYATELAVSAVLYCVITISVTKQKSVLALVLAIVLTALRVTLNLITHKKSDKKLAFTIRVKRLYIIAIIILGILLLLSAISTNVAVSAICRTLCMMLSIVTPALTFVVLMIGRLIEAVIRRKKS